MRKKFLKNGFIILKSVFAKEDISKLRNKMILLSSEDFNEFELLLDEDIQEILLNEKLIESIKEILATESLVYYSDSSITNLANPQKTFDRYHSDARGEDRKISYNEEYPIIRLGIYFQDSKDFSGGLKIRERSHKHILFKLSLYDILYQLKLIFINKIYNFNSFRLGKGNNIEIDKGDVVIWNLRTHHAGMSRRLKLFPKLCLWPLLDKLLPNSFFLPFQYKDNRVAMFSTFAKNDMSNRNILGYLNEKTVNRRVSQINLKPNLLKRLNTLQILCFKK